jgi:hypothetical protein
MTSPTRRIRLHAETSTDGKGLARLRDDLDKAAKGVDGLGDSMSEAEGDARSLEAQIARTKTQIRNLGEEFARTGDESLFKDLGKQRRLLANLEKIKKEAAEDGDDVGVTLGTAAAKSANKSFGSILDFGGAGLRPRNAAIGAIVAAAAFAAPTIGAMVAGAVTGAVGLGGIAGGIAAASNSPAVKLAAKNFAGNISAAFVNYGDQFVEPLVGALATLEQGFHDLNLESAFESVAAYVDDIARGLAGFGRNMMPGIMVALERAGPILEILGRELPRLGAAFGDMFATIASGKGTVEGFYFLLGAVKFTFEALGATIKFLSDAFHEWIQFVAGVSGGLEDVAIFGQEFQDQMRRINDITEDFIEKGNSGGQVMNYVGREMQNTAGAAQATTDAIRKLTDSMFDQHHAALALANTELAQAEAWLRLRESVKEHGTTLRRNTEEGLANHRMINDLVGGIMAIREANIENKMSVDEANRIYAAQIKRLQQVLVQMGFNEEQIKDLVAAYKQIPTRITTQIITEYQTKGKPPGEHSGIRVNETQGRAAGGPVLPGVPYMINERGRETVTFPAGGTVHPANLTPMTGSHISITINVPPGAHPRDVGRETVAAIRSYERANTSSWRNG